MKLNLPTLLLALAAITLAPETTAQIFRLNLPGQDQPASTSTSKDRSHSHLTSAFNTGPRQQAKLIPNIGNAHFPITTQNPLVQKFFDQGLNQLYSFMYFEAERSFRQCVMLEPENPMPFWALAMNDSGKAPEFLKLANQRRYRASAREQRFIDALKILHNKEVTENKQAKYKAALEQIVLDYPDDIEAKTILAQELYESADRTNGERTAVDALLKDVIAKNPLHPAANHFRIHLWDGPDARAALDSCERYPKAAPGIGHAQHMPGHIYAQLGLWEQAAYQMDAATRVERKWMAEARQLPHETWNYSHNQHYLIANLGYAGRLEEGERLARELIDAPRDPQGNNGFDFSVAGEGRFAMLRMWLRGERWDKILADEKAGWPNLPRGKTWRSFARILALIGKSSQSPNGGAATYLAEAEKALKEFEDSKPGGDAPICALMEAKGRLLMAQGLQLMARNNQLKTKDDDRLSAQNLTSLANLPLPLGAQREGEGGRGKGVGLDCGGLSPLSPSPWPSANNSRPVWVREVICDLPENPSHLCPSASICGSFPLSEPLRPLREISLSDLCPSVSICGSIPLSETPRPLREIPSDPSLSVSSVFSVVNLLCETLRPLREIQSTGHNPQSTALVDQGLAELKKAFDHEKEKFTYNDPGQYPRPAAEAYIQALLQASKPQEAEKAAKEALKHDPNNGFVLAQFAEALHAQNKPAEAQKAAEEFKEVFKHANPGLAPIARLRSLGLLGSWNPRPFDPPRALERLGPIAWQPFDAPDFTLPDMDGKKVRLSDIISGRTSPSPWSEARGGRGQGDGGRLGLQSRPTDHRSQTTDHRNVVLVFILSGSCEHCIQQLQTFATEKEEWAKLNTEVLVVSPDKPEYLRATFGPKPSSSSSPGGQITDNRSQITGPPLPFRFLSDPDHRVAKLYKAYDEFENLELHATNFITPEGKLWWFRTGSTPFTDMKFLKGEIERVEKTKARRRGR